MDDMTTAAYVETENTDALDFAAGFNGTETAHEEPTPTPEPEPTPAPESQVPETPAIKYAQITEDQFRELTDKANRVDQMAAENKRLFDTAFGRLGTLQQRLEAKQDETKAGEPVEITEDDLADLADFPELSSGIKAALVKVAGKLRGTGQAFDPSQVETSIQQRLAPAMQSVVGDVERMIETRLLSRQHKDWREVTKSAEFAAWRQSKPSDFNAQLDNSWDADFIGEALSEFKEAQQAKAAAEQAEKDKQEKSKQRQSVLGAAVTPRSAGNQPASRSAMDDFNAGFYGK